MSKVNCIVLLHETHSTLEIENKWNAEWASEIWFSHGPSNTNGVVTFSEGLRYCFER